MLEDSYKHQGQRKRLISELKKEGIKDAKVLQALEHVPRHFFFPADFEEKAYENIAFPIAKGQTISQPYTVARQTELLNVTAGMKILEIGTGSGYQAAILKVLGAEVHTIETVQELHYSAQRLFQKLGLAIHTYLGDGSKGLPEHAPYDRILMTAAAPKLSEHLAQQLKLGGKLLAPVGSRAVQKMILIERIGENEFKKSTHGTFTFVPLTGTYGWQK